MNPDTPPLTAGRGRGCRRVLTVGGALMLLACGGGFYRIYTFSSGGQFQIGPETTVIEGPLLPDGRVDYVSALNRQMSEGVTPENNAAVPLLQAFGPEIIRAEHRQSYFQLLGVPEAPLEGDYAIIHDDWVRRNRRPNSIVDTELESAQQDQFDAVIDRPWSPAEYPEAAAWLQANAVPLERIVAATERSRFYSPFHGGSSPPLFTTQLPLQQAARTAARLLVTRAMLRLSDGDTEAAWDDLLACHRLSRLIGQGETVINDLVAAAIFRNACDASVSLAQDDRLTAEQALRFTADLKTLSPLPDISATFDVTERFATIDTFQSLAHGYTPVDSPELQPIAGRGLDWGLMMRVTNERFDMIVEAFRQDTHRARIESLQSLEAEMQAVAAGSFSPAQIIPAALVGSRRREIADVLLARLAPAFVLTGAYKAVTDTRLRMLRIALMLGAYRANHGDYPIALDELTPDYFTEIPLDPFLGRPFHYERIEAGYRMYSVGDNMTDDGGLTNDPDPRADDRIVETPAVETPLAD